MSSTHWPGRTNEAMRHGGWKGLGSRFAPSHTIVLALIFIGAMAVGWAVLPGEDERIEALERDGQTSRALALLQSRYDRGDRRQRTLVSLRRFYDYYGDSEKSLLLLEQLAAQRPRDLYLQRQLAQFYRQVEDEPNQIRVLKAQLVIRFSEPVCQRLIGLLRRAGDFAAEQVALNDCRANGYKRQEDLERLAFLFAADGNLGEAAQILKAVDDRRWLRGSRERLLLFDALIATKLPEDALRRGIRWYKGQPDEDFALEMISRLVAAERNDLGFKMAKDVGKPGDAVTLAAGEILVDQVQYEAARFFLSGWLQQAGDLSSETATRFVTAAIDAEDAPLALTAAETVGLRRFRPTLLVQLAEALLAAGKMQDFDKVRTVLPVENQSESGLVRAGIELREGHMDAARSVLASLTVDPADERRVALRAQLTAQAGRAVSTAPLVREPLRTETILGTPNVTVAPGETRARRISVPVEVARRFKSRRLATRPPKQAQSQPLSPFFVPSPFPGANK